MIKNRNLLLFLLLFMGCTETNKQIYVTDNGQEIEYISTASIDSHKNDVLVNIEKRTIVKNKKPFRCATSSIQYKPEIAKEIDPLALNVSVKVSCDRPNTKPSDFYYFDWRIYDEKIDLPMVKSLLIPHLNQVDSGEELWELDSEQEITTSIYDDNLFEIQLLSPDGQTSLLMVKKFDDVLIVGVVPQFMFDEQEHFYEWFFLLLHGQTITLHKSK